MALSKKEALAIVRHLDKIESKLQVIIKAISKTDVMLKCDKITYIK